MGAVLYRCAAKSVLAAGTNLGNILMWRHQPQQEPADTGQHDNEVSSPVLSNIAADPGTTSD